MKPVWILARRELAMLLNSPTTYVIAVLFLLMTGWLFASPLFQMNLSVLDTFSKPLPIIFTILIPALTMRAFSEEYRAGTMEVLATLPLEDYQIVLGKYLAVMSLLAMLLGFTLVYPLILFIVGRPDLGQMIGVYLALVGLGSFFAAIGLWASSLTRNQVVALITGFFVCFAFSLLDRVADLFPDLLAGFIRAWSVGGHFEALTRGVVDSRDLLYWGGGTVFFLSACLSVVHSRRWR
jgi:ABC-2 type transport system permease protein